MEKDGKALKGMGVDFYSINGYFPIICNREHTL